MSSIQPLPNAGQVRAAMPGDVRRRSLLVALAVLLPSMAVYLLAWVLTIISPWWLWPVLSPLTGVAAGLLFVVAHDAARFRKRRAHQALERIDGVVNGLDRRANPSFVFFGFVRIERFQGVIRETQHGSFRR